MTRLLTPCSSRLTNDSPAIRRGNLGRRELIEYPCPTKGRGNCFAGESSSASVGQTLTLIAA
jgi:hypothetical protein